VHFLQIWITPDEEGVKPNYAEKSLGEIETGKLNLIASKSGRANSIAIHQDADVFIAKLGAETLEHQFEPQRSGWIQLIEGELDVNGKKLGPGDGAAITAEEKLQLASTSSAHFLFFDLN
jgi:redox-sensitive bicupin YhaK (pirin superfamily)